MSRVILSAVSLAAVLALAGCGSQDGAPDHAADAARPRTASNGSESTPSAGSSAATSDPTPTATTGSQQDRHEGRHEGRHRGRHRGRHKVGTLAPRGRTNAAAHLLDAARMPAAGGRTWTVGTDAPDDRVGACQKTALESIGAVDAVGRRFTADDGLTATQVVARFADARSAWRAHRVLVAWRDDCEGRVAHAAVGRLRPVRVGAGSADSYRGSFGTHDRAATLGILRTGAYLTLVEVTSAQGAYPTGWDPARQTVRRVARTF